jgi:1-acyl-sn-glycerol-3-phosphate acyltransferase
MVGIGKESVSREESSKTLKNTQIEPTDTGIVWQYYVFVALLTFLRIKVVVEGEPVLKEMVIAPFEHISHTDHLAVLKALGKNAYRRLGIVYKGRYWSSNPVYQWIVKHLAPPYSLGIDANGESEETQEFIKLETNGVTLIIYPQGTRQHGARLRKGAFAHAVMAGKGIQLVLIDYGESNPLPKGEPLLTTVLNAILSWLLLESKSEVHVSFSPPLYPPQDEHIDKTNLREVVKAARALQTQFEELIAAQSPHNTPS